MWCLGCLPVCDHQRCARVIHTLELHGASQPELTTTAFALLRLNTSSDATWEAMTWEICIAATIITFSLPFWRNQNLFCHCMFRISMLEGMKSTFRSNCVSFFWDVEPHKLSSSEKSPTIIHSAYCFLDRLRKVHVRFFFLYLVVELCSLISRSENKITTGGLVQSKGGIRISINFSRGWGRPNYCSSVCLLLHSWLSVLAKFRDINILHHQQL